MTSITQSTFSIKVDSFQGQEADIIILSFVRSNQYDEIGFLSHSNRICVALSRAKHGFYAVGNFDMLAKKDDLWRDIIDVSKQTNSYGTRVEAGCECIKFAITDLQSFKSFELQQVMHCSCVAKIH